MSKRGQVTIFIIAAIVIIAIVGLIFVFRGNGLRDIGPSGDSSPEGYMKSCTEKKIREGIKILSDQGGDIIPEIYSDIEGKNVSYLCYNHNYYLKCVNQNPLLINHVKNEIKGYIQNDVESCYNSLIRDLERKSDEVKSNYGDFEVVLRPGFVEVTVNSNIEISDKDSSRSYREIKFFIDSKIYDNLVVAQEITSQEAEYCSFEQIGFGLIYPEFKIDKFRMGDLTTYYKITNKKSQEEFQFLIRSCAIPPGF